MLMTSASRNSSKTYKYDAFGNVYSQTGSVANSYQYTGREWDSESALYYYRALHYDPKVGRFLQQDLVPPRPEEMNSYVFVSNRPVNGLSNKIQLLMPVGREVDGDMHDPNYCCVRLCLSASALVGILVLSLSAVAVAKIAVLDMPGKARYSSDIVYCEVIRTQRYLLGRNTVTIEILEPIKGKLARESALIRYGDVFRNRQVYDQMFKKGHKYVLFLYKDDNELRILGEHRGVYPVDAEGMVRNDAGELESLDRFVGHIRISQ